MLFINLGIMAGAYIGVRLFEHYHDKKSSTPNSSIQSIDKQKDFHKVVIAKDNSNLQLVKSNDITDTTLMNAKTFDHHAKISFVTLGLSFISYFYPQIAILTVSVITYNSIPMLKRAEDSLLKEKRFNNDTLSAIVTILSVAVGKYFVSATQIFAYHFGNKMVNKSQNTSNQILTKLFHQQPKQVWILKDHVELEIPLEELKINDIVVVKTGEVMPIDGTIIQGMATIDQHALTGEATPVEKGIGDQVFAATLMISGKIQIKVEKAGVDTTVSKLCEILNHTATFQTQLQLKGQQWADKAAIPLLSMSLLSYPLFGISSTIGILFSAPTNSIRVFTSLHTFNHLSLILQQGILIKDGRALEELTQIDTILFDKTGTLTTEQPEIGQIIRCDELTEDDILTYAASAERRLSHPIARAIVKKAEEHQLNLLEIEEANYKIGYGITVNFNNQEIQVGSVRFMSSEGISIPPNIADMVTSSQQEGYTLIMVAINQQLKGVIEIRPHVRPEVKQIISDLRKHGIQKMYIVSGDHEQPTQKLAKELGMDNYFYEVAPQEKAMLVEQLQKQGHHVCFVGDGINDAIAMKQANVSISLTGATSIATDMAQVVLMDGSLSHLCGIFKLSTQLDTRLRQSLAYCTTYGIVNLIGTSAIGLTKTAMFFSLYFGIGMAHTMLPLKPLKSAKKITKEQKNETKKLSSLTHQIKILLN